MDITDTSMATTIDLVLGVSNSLVNLPVESEFIDVSFLVESRTQEYIDSVSFDVPTDVQEFDAFL